MLKEENYVLFYLEKKKPKLFIMTFYSERESISEGGANDQLGASPLEASLVIGLPLL